MSMEDEPDGGRSDRVKVRLKQRPLRAPSDRVRVRLTGSTMSADSDWVRVGLAGQRAAPASRARGARLPRMHPNAYILAWFPGILLLGLPPLISYLVFIYKAWNRLDRRAGRPSPGAAVGLHFVPLFNIYWFFRSMYPLGACINEDARWRRANAYPVSEGMAKVAAVCMALSAIPFAGLVATLVLLFLVPTMMASYASALNALAEA